MARAGLPLATYGQGRQCDYMRGRVSSYPPARTCRLVTVWRRSRPSQGRPKVARRGSLDGAGLSLHSQLGSEPAPWPAPTRRLSPFALRMPWLMIRRPISNDEMGARMGAVKVGKRQQTWADVGYRNAGIRSTWPVHSSLRWRGALPPPSLGREPVSVRGVRRDGRGEPGHRLSGTIRHSTKRSLVRCHRPA